MDTDPEECFDNEEVGAHREGKAFQIAGTACAKPPTLGSLSSKSNGVF